MVPERLVERSDAARIVLVDGEDYDGRDVLNAEYRRCPQTVERRAQRTSVRYIADIIRFLVELWRTACGKTQAVFPRRFERGRHYGIHQVILHGRRTAPPCPS